MQTIVYRSCRKSRRAHNRSGAVVIITVIALIGLMACAALAVDIGHMLMVMSRAQSLADAAALAGAGDTMANHYVEVVDRVESILNANALPKMPTRFDANDLIFYREGNTIPGFRELLSCEEAVRVKISIEANYTFARVLGLSTRVIEREATALRISDDVGNGVIFAIDPDPSHLGIDMSGTGILVDGLSHSNTQYDITGSSHHFTGPVEWVNRFRVMGGWTVFDIGDVESTVLPSPLNYDPSDFEPYDFEVNGDYDMPSSGVVPPGVYRVYGSVHVSGSSQRLEGVTFVADGDIIMNGSNHLYTPARRGVFAFSLSSSQSAIDVRGAGPDCWGTLYAPNGRISFSSQDNIITRSSIVGMRIDMAGQNYIIRPTPDIGGGGLSVRLVK